MGFVTSEEGITREYAGCLALAVRIIATDEIIVFLTPDEVEVDFGLKTKSTNTSNPLGQMSEANRYTIENMPTAMFKIGANNTQNAALAANRGVEKVAASPEKVLIRKQATVGQTPPAPSGGLGFGILEDAVTNASAHFGGDPSVPLVQQPWATFAPATPLSFAIGANSAIKFSTDLVTERAYVSLISTEIIDIVQMKFNDLGLTEWTIKMRNSDDTITKIFIPTIKINPEGAKVASKSDGIQVKGNISITSGCAGYQIKDFKRKVFC
jgi:hypothetical protein